MAGVDYDPYYRYGVLDWVTSTTATFTPTYRKSVMPEPHRVVCTHCECYVLRDRPTCEQCGSPLGRSIAKEPA